MVNQASSESIGTNLSAYTASSLGELKDVDVDAFVERLNDRWRELSNSDKRRYDIDRFNQEQRDDGAYDEEETHGERAELERYTY